MKKPHVICHMASTINGKIIAENWGDQRNMFSGLYDTVHSQYGIQTWMCGRVTMEKDFTGGRKPDLIKAEKPIERIPFIGNKDANRFAIAVDATGKLGWQASSIGEDHIIAVLTEQVTDEYLYFLQRLGISYLFGGVDELDFQLVLNQLAELFSIEAILLEGGGYVNGSLLSAELIDELSLLLLPIIDSSPDAPTTFETGEPLKAVTAGLALNEVKHLEGDVLWLTYRTTNQH